MTQHPGWFLVCAGLVIAGIGIVWLIAASIPWRGRLPGDMAIERENFKFYFDLDTARRKIIAAQMSLIDELDVITHTKLPESD